MSLMFPVKLPHSYPRVGFRLQPLDIQSLTYTVQSYYEQVTLFKNYKPYLTF